MKWEGGKEKKNGKDWTPHTVRHTDAHAFMQASAHAHAWKYGITFFSYFTCNYRSFGVILLYSVGPCMVDFLLFMHSPRRI